MAAQVKEIPRHRLPSFWSGMSFVAKAGWLCGAHLAKDFNEVCSMLAQARRPRTRPTPAEYTARMEQQKLF